MCAVSMISDTYGRYEQDPFRFQQPPEPLVPRPWPNTLPTTLPWDRQALDDLKDILRRLDALDKKLGLAECEDPKKAEWMKGIEDRLTALESAHKETP